MLILGLLRRVFEATLLMKSKQWALAAVVARGIYDFQGRTLGILGLGGIGREVARRAAAFAATVCYHDQHRLPAAEEAALRVTFSSFDDLLCQADIVTCHVPYTPQT